MRNAPKLVVLLHGWLGRPGAFGRLPKMLAERGHAVLPLFHQFDSWPRGVTIEELAERLEACLERERRDRPTVLIAHSMGGLVAMAWMLRHHAENGRRPPVERLVTFGTPRHGVCLQPFARAFIRWGLVPGTALARQMQAPNPFLWDLAWSELRHAARLPPIVAGAGVLHRFNPVSALVGGRESDSVVPTVCAQPNPLFLSADGKVATLPPRAFHVFTGRAHNGPRGLYAGLKAPEHDLRSAILLAAIEDGAATAASDRCTAAAGLQQALCVVKHAPGTNVELPVRIAGVADRHPPAVCHADGLSLFLLKVPVAETVGIQTIAHGHYPAGSSKSLSVAGGQVAYIDHCAC
jgi:pimeloyl-ACP methyl ester carboxylesterase